MVASPIEQVQIDPVVALQIAKCFNDERAQDEDRIVSNNHIPSFTRFQGSIDWLHRPKQQRPRSDPFDPQPSRHWRFVRWARALRSRLPQVHPRKGLRSPPSRLVHKLPQLRDLHSFFLEQLGLFPGIFYTLKHNESNHQSQMNLTESTVLVYDPLKTAQGQCSFRAFRISQDYIDMINYDAENDYWPEPTLKELRDGKISTKVENPLFFNAPMFLGYFWRNPGCFEDFIPRKHAYFRPWRSRLLQPPKILPRAGNFCFLRKTPQVITVLLALFL